MQSFKKHLAEKLKASDDMGTWVKDFQDSDAPQFKSKSKEKKRQMAIAAKLDAERNESLDPQSQYDLVEAYLLENNIDADSLSVEQLDEIIGKVLGTAFKVGAKTAVGAARLAKKAVVNKQGNIRGTQAAKQDAAGDRAEKEARKKEAEFKRKKRIQDMKKRASDLDQKISDLSNNK